MTFLFRRSSSKLVWFFLCLILASYFLLRPVLLTPAYDASDLTVRVEKIDGDEVEFDVVLAQTPAERERGLQNVRRVKRGHGMWFIFEDDAERIFWMKDTFTPLDILFVSADGRIRTVYEKVPTCISVDSSQSACPLYTSGVPVRYVLEIRSGEIHRLGISVGDLVRFSL